jgi:hypothetical protein
MNAQELPMPHDEAREHSPSAIERLLETALAPVEPPASLVDELEGRLTEWRTAALETLEELSEWELEAIKDPRNWVRPVAALAVGTAAGAALVVLQLRRSRRQRPAGLRGLAEQGGRSLAGAVDSTRSRLR